MHTRTPNRAWWAALLAAVACTRTRAAEGEGSGLPPMPPMPVEVSEVRAVPLRDATEYVATLRSRRSVEVHPQLGGYVVRIAVKSGDIVEPGALLMRLDARRQQAATRGQEAVLAARRADAQYLRRERDRMVALRAAGAVTQQEVERAISAHRAAEAQVEAQGEQVRAQAVLLKYHDVVAPWGGVVGDIPVRLGDLATPETLLTTIDDNATLETYIEVTLDRAADAKLGTPVDVLDERGELLAHTALNFISPRASADTQTLLMKAPIDNGARRLRSWQFVRAVVIWAERQGPAVPVLAVQNRNGQSFAWVVERSDAGAWIAQPRVVDVGAIQGNVYPIRRGLGVGERVVVAGVQKLRPGAPVEPGKPQRDGGG